MRTTVRQVVVDDPDVAIRLVGAGANVVLIVSEGAVHGEAPDGPGRLAILVGDPGDPATRAAAAAMDAELFPDAR